MDSGELAGVERDPALGERLAATAELWEAATDLIEAITGDPVAEQAYDRLEAAWQRWLDVAPVADDD